MDYSREYGQLHAKGKYFPGFSISPYVPELAKLVEQHKPRSLLDYGSGRGLQYLKRRVHEEWGGLLPYCYDIGVNGLHEKPMAHGPFGGVICTDMLEHIAEADLPGILDDLVGFTKCGGFMFLVISCRPSKKKLPSGGDVHVTVKPPSWWRETLMKALAGAELHAVVHFDVAGHFDEPEEPWEYVG